MTAPKLELYFFESCPFCQKVISTIEQYNLLVIRKDTKKDKEAFAKLIDDTGRKTVPILYIDGSPMSESSDIIKWLEENLDDLDKNS